eukprot:gene9390-1637_t
MDENDNTTHTADENCDVMQLEALKILSAPDAILEASVLETIQLFIKNKGNPSKLVVQLADSYHGFPQMAQLICAWLETTGMSVEEIEEYLISFTTSWIKERFDAKIVDAAISQRRKASKNLSWLKTLMDNIATCRHWRYMIYGLSETVQSETFFLDLAVKTMVEKELYNPFIQFLRIALVQHRFTLSFVITHSDSQTDQERMIDHLCTIGTVSKVVYMYTQALLHCLVSELNDDIAIKVIKQFVEALQEKASSMGHSIQDVMFLLTATTSGEEVNRIATMLHSNQITMADVDYLYRLYTSDEIPPVSYLQTKGMLELLAREVFVGMTLNEQHALQCSYLLAFATCVAEDQPITPTTHDNITATRETIDAILSLTQPLTKSSWLQLMNYIDLPVIGYGMLLFIDRELSDLSCFLNFVPASPPPMIILLEKIAEKHISLRSHTMRVLTDALHRKYSLDAMALSAVHRFLMSRLLYLFSLGFVIPILKYLEERQDDLDTSLIVFFILEIVDSISSPFSTEFVEHFSNVFCRSRTLSGIKVKGERLSECCSFLREMSETEQLLPAVVSKLENALSTLKSPSSCT